MSDSVVDPPAEATHRPRAKDNRRGHAEDREGQQQL